MLHHWFVQYNPLYFFSALCVLTGMLLVSRGLDEMGWHRGQLILSAVIQVYELLLLTGAAILFRLAKERRPAVILGLLAAFFLFDTTFQTEILATLPSAPLLSAGWLALLATKLLANCWIFGLRPRLDLLWTPILLGALVVAVPHWIQALPAWGLQIHLAAFWCGLAVVYATCWRPPRAVSTVSLNDWGRTVLHRSVRSAHFIWIGFYGYHAVTWFGMFHIPPTIAHFTPIFLLAPFISGKEKTVWASGIFTVAVTLAATDPVVFAPVALMAAAGFALQGIRMNIRRLHVGAVLCAHIGIWTLGRQWWPLPPQLWWLNLLTGALLLAMAWRWRLRLALLAALAGLLPLAWKALTLLEWILAAFWQWIRTVAARLYRLIADLLPDSLLEWGILLLVTGFASLIVGVAINWHKRKPSATETQTGKPRPLC